MRDCRDWENWRELERIGMRDWRGLEGVGRIGKLEWIKMTYMFGNASRKCRTIFLFQPCVYF